MIKVENNILIGKAKELNQQKDLTEKWISKWNFSKETALKDIEKWIEDSKKWINE